MGKFNSLKLIHSSADKKLHPPQYQHLRMMICKLQSASRNLESRSVDTFGDKPQRLSLGTQSRKHEGLFHQSANSSKAGDEIVALSVNPEGEQYRKQAPRLALGVFRRIDNILF